MARDDLFGSTVQKTHLWIKELMQELGWEQEGRTYLALRSTLHTLRDRLPVDEAAHFGSQLPLLLRGAYYEGWKPAKVPMTMDRDQFLERVGAHFSRDPDFETEPVVKGVFRFLARKVDAGELADIQLIMPRDLQMLWPQPAGAGTHS